MLKVLYLPIGDQPGVCDAWRNIGTILEVFGFYDMYVANKNAGIVNENLIQKVQEFQPDLLHMQLQITGIITAATLQKIRQICPGIIITNWSGDIRNYVIQELAYLKGVVDWNLISSTGQLQMYHKDGCHNTKYWQIGLDPNFCKPLYYDNFDYDVSFIANSYGNLFPGGPTRSQSVDKCRQAFGNKFGLFGAGWGISQQINPRDANEIYNKSICTLSVSNFNDVAHYFSDRLLSCLGSGRPTISWYFPGAESYFVEGSEIFYARHVDDIVNIVNFCKQNPDIATQVGINGYKKALKEHSFTAKAIELLHMTGLIDRI